MPNVRVVVPIALALVMLGGCGGTVGETAGEGGERSATAAAAADPAQVRQAIEAANAKAIEGWKVGDSAPLLSNYEDGAVLLQPGMPIVRGRSAWEGIMSGMMQSMDFKDPQFRTDDVVVSGDLAVETGFYRWMIGPKGSNAMAADSGKYLTVWRRQADGSWKIIRDANNSDIAPPG